MNRIPINPFNKFPLQLESNRDSRNRCVDYVEIRDGGRINSSMMGLYCGTETPPDILSVGNELYVQFSSDNSFSYNGFKAVYSRGRYPNTYQFFVPIYYIQSQKLYNLGRTQIIFCRMQNEHLFLYHLQFVQITIFKVKTLP